MLRHFARFALLTILSTFILLGNKPVLQAETPRETADWFTPNPIEKMIDEMLRFFEQLQTQYPNGLVAINEHADISTTYTAAMDAIASISEGELEEARHIFNIFLNNSDQCLNCSCLGGFQQFRDPETGQALTNTDKNDFWVGDNAWLLVSLKYYKSATNDNQYDALIEQLKGWFICLAEETTPPPGIHGGYTKDGIKIDKHPEGSIDVYGALSNLGPEAEVVRASILQWINQEVWVPNGDCYDVGSANANNLPLDNVSWAALALGEDYHCLLTLAEERLAISLEDQLYIIDAFDRAVNWHLAKSDDPDNSISIGLGYERQGDDTDLVVQYSWNPTDEWFLFFREESINLKVTDQFNYFVRLQGDGSGNQFEVKLYNERSPQGNEAIFWYTLPLNFTDERMFEIPYSEFRNFANPDNIPLSHITKIEFAINNTSDTTATDRTIRIGEIWYTDPGQPRFPVSGFSAFETEKNWLFVEGAGQMAAAYCVAGQPDKWRYYIDELNKMVWGAFDGTVLGLPTFITGGVNEPTPEVAATAWYSVAYRGLNPFEPQNSQFCGYWQNHLSLIRK